MVHFTIRIHPEQRLTRIPKILTQNFGTIWTLVPKKEAADVFPEKADLETVLKSIAIIQQDLELRVESNKRSK